MTGYSKRLQVIEQRLAYAASQSGRQAERIRVLPVSKTFPVEVLREAMRSGAREFGENRPQELAAKAAQLGQSDMFFLSQGDCSAVSLSACNSQQPHRSGFFRDGGSLPGSSVCADAPKDESLAAPCWVQIGSLQRNKAKLIAAHAAQLQSLDSLKLAQTLSRLLQENGRELSVMIQVNTSGEETKHGVTLSQAWVLAQQVLQLDRLHLVGFMTVAQRLETAGESRVRESFASLRQLRDRACSELSPQISELSMGMSADFELAVREGSTCLRLGSALFGSRSYPV